MDSVLKELKQSREETENRLNEIITQLESANKKLDSRFAELSTSQNSQGEGDSTPERGLIALMQEMLSGQHGYVLAIRNIIMLNNGRSAELARQLTVLPLERMDIALDKFEGRLESLEAELNRLKKK